MRCIFCESFFSLFMYYFIFLFLNNLFLLYRNFLTWNDTLCVLCDHREKINSRSPNISSYAFFYVILNAHHYSRFFYYSSKLEMGFLMKKKTGKMRKIRTTQNYSTLLSFRMLIEVPLSILK